MNALRDTIRTRIREAVGAGQIDLSRGPDDTGLFARHSVAWAVHGDFTSMLIGGVSALMLQMLHPGALAGVWDHSDFRRDMAARLRRTAQFVAGTTYGSRAVADAMIARVRQVHDRVVGTLPDGTPYSANDPHLLTWVHVAEADSFLRAHVRYRDPGMPGARQDAYLAEMAVLARALGAEAVPESRAAVAAYYRAIRPELVSDARTRAVAQVLMTQRSAGPQALDAVLLQAGVDLLPGWAAALHARGHARGHEHGHGITVPRLRRPAVRLGAAGMGAVLRWAMRD